MNHLTLSQIEKSILQLPIDEQLLIISRVTQRIRGNIIRQHDIEKELDAMANDEHIQRELKQINKEFSSTESDGLESL